MQTGVAKRTAEEREVRDGLTRRSARERGQCRGKDLGGDGNAIVTRRRHFLSVRAR